MAQAPIRIEGLAEFRRELRAAGAKFPREIAKANREAADIVATTARGKAEAQGGVARKAAPSIRAGGTQRAGIVRAGGDRYPYYFGSDFGSVRFKQFPSFLKGGRIVYPSWAEKRPVILERHGEALERALKGAFPL